MNGFFNRPEAKYRARMAMRDVYPHPMLVTLAYVALTGWLVMALTYFVANPFSIALPYLAAGYEAADVLLYIFTPGRVGAYLVMQLLITLYQWVMSYGYAAYALGLALDRLHSPFWHRVALGIALSPEGRQVFPEFSVEANLRMGAYTMSKSELAEGQEQAYTLFPILKERRRQAAGTLSGGEQQMLAVARALMCKPKLLMLDEPSLGLAPLIVAEIFKLIRRINEMGTTILLVEQNARMALRISNRGYVLETGNIVLSGKGSDLAVDEKVRAAYLGGL